MDVYMQQMEELLSKQRKNWRGSTQLVGGGILVVNIFQNRGFQEIFGFLSDNGHWYDRMWIKEEYEGESKDGFNHKVILKSKFRRELLKDKLLGRINRAFNPDGEEMWRIIIPQGHIAVVYRPQGGYLIPTERDYFLKSCSVSST